MQRENRETAGVVFVVAVKDTASHERWDGSCATATKDCLASCLNVTRTCTDAVSSSAPFACANGAEDDPLTL